MSEPRKSETAASEQRMSRRTFTSTMAASGVVATSAFSIVPRHVLGGARFVAPSDKVNLALIGCGGRARGNMRGLMQHADAQIIAVADPAETSDMRGLRIYKSIAGRLPLKAEVEQFYREKTPRHRCADYEDFREMLEDEPAIDAVVISTPDHQHAHGTLHAMRMGKHAYCEKPLTHNIRESRLVAKVARETGVATQMGNLGHSRDSMARIVEAIRADAIGTVREVHAWVPATRWNPSLLAPPTEKHPVPKGMNWDLWLGPRPSRAFHPAYAPVHWRDFWDFGCGALGDFGCHELDSATWALDLAAPSTVEAFNAGKTHDQLAPHGSVCHFHFPASGAQKEVQVTWYDGGLMPQLPPQAEPQRSKYRRGVMFVGDKGYMLCQSSGRSSWIILHDSSATSPEPEATIPRVSDHYRDWLDACKGGRPALSNFEYGARLNEITLLGVLAVRLGVKLQWDGKSARVKNLDKADELIQGTYRQGWELT